MRLIAIDPGVTSGYVYGDLSKEGLIFHPFQEQDDVQELWKRLHRIKPRWIIIEDFEFRRGTYAGSGGGGLELFPRELIGIAKLYSLEMVGCRFFLQNAAQGKSYYTNDVLKRMKFYKRGISHGMDATRHLFQWITFGPGYQYLGRNKLEDFAVMTDILWRE